MFDQQVFLCAQMKKSKKKGKSKHHNPIYIEDETGASEECVGEIHLMDSISLQEEFDLLTKGKSKHHNPTDTEDETEASEEDVEQIYLNSLGLQEEMNPLTKIKMLKSSKLSRKPHKSKDSIRKSHLSRKNMRSRSPVRHPGNSRPPPMKHMSPGMKRGHPVPKRKASHSPRLRPFSSSPHRSLSHRSKPESPVPVERARPMKNLKYDKRRRLSNSPVRHLGPSGPRRPVSPHAVREISPYLSEQYQSSTIPHPQQYSPPIRKKTRRSMSASPPRRHAAVPMHSNDHIPRRAISPVVHQKHHRNMALGPGEREKLSYDIRTKHESPHPMPRSHSKEVSLKIPYPNQGPRYRSPSPSNRYPPSGSKSYGPTLHERFSSVIESNRTEPRVRYSREDLEKITIDIRRNVRDPSPIPRHGVNQSNAKLIRRADEGHRPIFDREEIKGTRYLREEVYVDSKSTPYNTVDLRNVENYQVTRLRYDSHNEVLPSTSGRPLSDRWPAHEVRKDTVSLDRDEREKEYVRVPVSRSLVVRSRSRSGDRDFRSERYIDAKPSSSRAEYPSRPLPPPEPRSSAPYPPRKNDLPPDSRHKLNFRKTSRESHPSTLRSEVKSHYVPSELHYPEDLPPPRVDRREHHSPVPEPHRWEYKSRSPSREKFSDYPRRPEKYDYKPWNDRPDMSPKGPSHFQHESREGPSSFRGSNRPFRSPRGFRGRGFRGTTRGSSYRGGSYRGGYRTSSSPRGRGIPRR